jgi:EAL domain-containing protein (putative c-di-GMP-specific phosphodiesterase class I)
MQKRLIDANPLAAAFLDGAKYWEWVSTNGTMWTTDQETVAVEALRRYQHNDIICVSRDALIELLAEYARTDSNDPLFIQMTLATARLREALKNLILEWTTDAEILRQQQDRLENSAPGAAAVNICKRSTLLDHVGDLERILRENQP